MNETIIITQINAGVSAGGNVPMTSLLTRHRPTPPQRCIIVYINHTHKLMYANAPDY